METSIKPVRITTAEHRLTISASADLSRVCCVHCREQWSEGHLWQGEVSLSAGTDINMKFAKTFGSSLDREVIEWQDGEDLVLTVAAEATPLFAGDMSRMVSDGDEADSEVFGTCLTRHLNPYQQRVFLSRNIRIRGDFVVSLWNQRCRHVLHELRRSDPSGGGFTIRSSYKSVCAFSMCFNAWMLGESTHSSNALRVPNACTAGSCYSITVSPATEGVIADPLEGGAGAIETAEPEAESENEASSVEALSVAAESLLEAGDISTVAGDEEDSAPGLPDGVEEIVEDTQGWTLYRFVVNNEVDEVPIRYVPR